MSHCGWSGHNGGRFLAALAMFMLAVGCAAREPVVLSRGDQIDASLEQVGREREAIQKQAKLEDGWFVDGKKRAEMAPRLLPLERRRLALLEEQAAIKGIPLAADERARAYLSMALLGDAPAEATMKQTGEGQGDNAQVYRNMELLVRWLRSGDNPDEQTKIVNDVWRRYPTSRPVADAEEEGLEEMLGFMAQYGAAKPELRTTVQRLIVERLWLRMGQFLKQGIPDARQREEIRGQFVPLARRLVAILDEISPVIVRDDRTIAYRSWALVMLSVFGDSVADTRIEAAAKDKNAVVASVFQGAQLLARWMKAEGKAAEQARVLDDVQERVKAKPEDFILGSTVGLMAAYEAGHGPGWYLMVERLDAMIAQGLQGDAKSAGEGTRQSISRRKIPMERPGTMPSSVKEVKVDLTRLKQVVEEMRRNRDELEKMIPSLDLSAQVMSDPAKRAHACATLLPYFQKAFAFEDEMYALQGVAIRRPMYRATVLGQLAMTGDADAETALKIGAGSPDAEKKLVYTASLLQVRWMKAYGDSAEQGRVLDEFQALAKANPGNGFLAEVLGGMAREGGASAELKQRAQKIIAEDLNASQPQTQKSTGAGAQPTAQKPAAKRTPEQFKEELKQEYRKLLEIIMEAYGGRMTIPAKERAKLAPRIVPVAKKYLALLDEARTVPEVWGPMYRDERAGVLVHLCLFGDAEAEAALKKACQNADAKESLPYRCCHLFVRWFNAEGNAGEQGRILDDVSALAKTNGDEEKLGSVLGTMVEAGSANDAIRQRGRKIIETELRGAAKQHGEQVTQFIRQRTAAPATAPARPAVDPQRR